MRWVLLWAMAGLLIAGNSARAASHNASRENEVYLAGPAFHVGGLKFTIPSKWVSVPVDNPARAGQWNVPPPRGQTGGSGEVVAFYFGQGIGGTAKENIDAWTGTMFNTEGRPAAAEVKDREAGGCKISQVIALGTYRQVVPLAGMPPVSKPGYGLIGAVVENAQGNIYWRFTGPEALVTANLPLFNKIIDSLKPDGVLPK